MEREVRYCTTEDGVRIAYCVEGDGPPLLALPMFIESFSLDHPMPEHRQFLRDIAQGHQLIRFDIRGVGLSEKDADDESPEAIIRDGEAVLKACNVKQVVFWASTATGPYALEWALRHPRRMTKLVLYGTCSRLEDAIPAATLKAFAAMCGANWALASQALADMTGRRALPDAALKLTKWFHESSSGPFVERLILQNSDHNFGNRLREVKVPMLIVHRLEDPAFPFEVAQAMAAQIPGSRFVPLSGAAHLPFFGDAEQIVDVVTAFLNEGTEPRTPRRRRVSASRAVVRNARC
jgi:pimeloyl-ACP methyl ester carboxylesterase